MSKAIFSLFCVAALFNSGLVWANPAGSGDAVKNVGDQTGNLASDAIKSVADCEDPNSLECKGMNLLANLVNAGIDTASNLAGSAINGAVNGANKAKDLANAGYDAATAGIQRGTQAIKGNNGGNGQQQSGQQQSGQQQKNGGNTVQIPTIFFLILAIFNH